MILGKYKITYENGFVQTKNLIPHDFYLNSVEPILAKIDKLNKKRDDKEIQALKRELKSMVGSNWFTDKSPIFYAIETGILDLPSCQGGKKKCLIERIDEGDFVEDDFDYE